MDTYLADLYRSIVETTPDGIWVLDLDGRTLYANPEIARIHRVPVEDLVALTVFDTLDEPGRAEFAAHLDDVRRQGRLNPTDVEVQWVRSDGTTTWTLCRETALHDADGSVRALLHRHSAYDDRRDLVESLRAHEQALADEISQKQLLQAVASTANDSATMAEVLVQCRDLVLLHDDWERARGFVPESPGSTTMVPFYTVESDRDADVDDPFAETELALAQRAADEGRLLWDERRLTMAFPVMLDGDVYAVVAITSAPPLFRFELIESMAAQVAQQLARVAERERAQAQLAHARDEAMEASRLKSEFLATMSHEIRTPLNGVIGLNDLLLRTELDDEQLRLVAGLQVSSRALLSLINNILDFSKIEAGRLDLEEVAFEVRPLLAEVVAVQVEGAREQGIEITVTTGEHVPVALTGDPTKIGQVVTNLVANSVKFTPEGSVGIEVDAEPMTRATGVDEVLLRVVVRDTGTGVSGHQVPRLFEPFTQADSSTTRLYGGTGLGLAISGELASAMGGDITYEPNPGGGSVFTFTAVLGTADPADVAEVATTRDLRPVLSTPRARGVVLVVEDNPVNQLVASGMLAALGYDVVTADQGQAGVDAAGQGDYVAILMDVQMPVLDGYAAARAIRAAETGRRVPIIAMTAAAVEGVRERCLDAGMDDFLTKPVDVDRLSTTLEHWLFRADLGSAPSLSRLDLQRLEELRGLDGGSGEASYLSRAIGNLLASVPGDLETMVQSAAAGDDKRLCSVAHRLAGSALNLGATAGGEAARQLEHAVLNGTPPTDVTVRVAQLREELAADLAALADYRDRLLRLAS